MEEIKNWLKKNFKGSKLLPLIIILFYVITFFLGNFLGESKVLKRINPFTSIFGTTSVQIDSTNVIYPASNYSKVAYKILNTGDKDIENFFMNYKFCGLSLKTASLRENKLRIGENQEFDIEAVNLNTSCTPATEPVKLNIFFDNAYRCYIKLESPVTKSCGFCPVRFDIFGNGRNLANITKYQPYYEINVSTFEIMRKLSLNVDFKPKNYPPFKLSECLLVNDPNKFNLTFLDTVRVTILDPFTYCLQGQDPEWCAEYIYAKSS